MNTARRAGSLLLMLGLSACGSLNPFASSEKIPPLPAVMLTDIPTLAWRASVGAAGSFELKSALPDDKSMFAATNNGQILRTEKGRELWRVNAGVPLSAGVGLGLERLAVASIDGEVLTFDLDGKPQWRQRLDVEILATPVITDSLVLVRSTDNRIFALDLKDGKRRWVYQRSAPALVIRSTGSLVVAQGVAYAGFPGGKLVAISLNNGGALWEGTIALPRGTTELERVADVTGEPVLSGRGVCAVAFQGRVACLDRNTGGNLWSRELSSATGLALEGRQLYVSDERGNVLAFDASTGATLWRQEQLAGRNPSRPAPYKNTVAVVDAEGVVHFLSMNDGVFKARVAGPKPTKVSPQTSAAGVVVRDASGDVSAYALP